MKENRKTIQLKESIHDFLEKNQRTLGNILEKDVHGKPEAVQALMEIVKRDYPGEFNEPESADSVRGTG